VLPHRNFEIFGFWVTLWTHDDRYRPDRHTGVGAY
jgi:hypothetical protein